MEFTPNIYHVSRWSIIKQAVFLTSDTHTRLKEKTRKSRGVWCVSEKTFSSSTSASEPLFLAKTRRGDFECEGYAAFIWGLHALTRLDM
jgi:hypothetical protein